MKVHDSTTHRSVTSDSLPQLQSEKEYVAYKGLGGLPGGQHKAENLVNKTGMVRTSAGEGTVSLKRNTKKGWSIVDSKAWRGSP